MQQIYLFVVYKIIYSTSRTDIKILYDENLYLQTYSDRGKGQNTLSLIFTNRIKLENKNQKLCGN